jgi:hypothetical protein
VLSSLFRRRAEGRLAFARRRRKLHQLFRVKLGHAGNFEQPRSYHEKLQFRKLYGNHELYALVADKLRVREYVAKRAGEQYLIPLLGVYDRLSPAVFDALPDQFIIKTNHGAGWNRIVRDKGKLDIPETVEYFDRRMKKRFGRKSGEFHYSLIEPKILIEELLSDQGAAPCNYNLFCYHGSQGFDYAITISFPDEREDVNFDRHWNLWNGELSKETEKKYVDPKGFDEMIRVARALSSDFDFIRVDLYNIDGRIFFGEMTCTPAAGLSPFDDEFHAARRTEMWELDADNELLYKKPGVR